MYTYYTNVRNFRLEAAGISKLSVWRSDIDGECINGTAPFMYDVLARWLQGSPAS